MALRPLAGSQCPMRHTIPKREWLFRRMQKLSQNGMIAGQKLRPICQGDMNHNAPQSQQFRPGLNWSR